MWYENLYARPILDLELISDGMVSLVQDKAEEGDLSDLVFDALQGRRCTTGVRAVVVDGGRKGSATSWTGPASTYTRFCRRRCPQSKVDGEADSVASGRRGISSIVSS